MKEVKMICENCGVVRVAKYDFVKGAYCEKCNGKVRQEFYENGELKFVR